MSTLAPGSPPAPRGIMRVITSPAFYIGWTIIVFVALAVSWPIDPYLFALMTLVAGAGTIGVGLAGIIAQVRAEPPIRTRVIIASSITGAGMMVAIALVMLARVRWA